MLTTRIIPARAGKTFSSRLSRSASAGSSPRGRGKQQVHDAGQRLNRIIPARAGKTVKPRSRIAWLKDHPRAGGENFKLPEARRRVAGSSPRGRGKRDPGAVGRRAPGIIPARAGKTWTALAPLTNSWDHPRAGGENDFGDKVVVSHCGSSPRGRGKPCRQCESGPSPRIIPARAGKTRPWRQNRPCAPDHPRAGGENAVHTLSA